jgi:hypothetical protein
MTGPAEPAVQTLPDGTLKLTGTFLVHQRAAVGPPPGEAAEAPPEVRP